MFCVVNIHFGVHLVSKLVKLLVFGSMASFRKTLAELTRTNLMRSACFGQVFIFWVFGFYLFFTRATLLKNRFKKDILAKTVEQISFQVQI
jgi:hypothetical protein